MTVSKSQIEQILKTLPIGYYINRDVKVLLTDESSSYYDLMQDIIHISYPMLNNVIASLPKNETIENDIRCLLYHELSHAFITPKQLQIDNIINVFEDERIESILRHYYRNVNFREFVKRINNFKNEQPKTAFELYYQIVRYRIGPAKFLDRVTNIILDNTDLISKSWYIHEYTRQIYELYRDIEQYFNNKQPNDKQLNDKQSQNSQTNNNRSAKTTDDATNQTNNNNANNNCIQDRSNSDDEDFNNATANEIVLNNVGQYDSSDMYDKLEKILQSIKHSSKQNSTAINAYSGIFNPRSVIRDDYKYFVQQNRIGHVKAYSKLHLNLFIDCSGSFQGNDKTVNKLLKALIKFEKLNNNFSFDLIACGIGQKLRTKNERIQKSNGGTLITDEMNELYRKLQLPEAQNINICLYDGNAMASSDYCDIDKDIANATGFKCFNNRHSILIVDYSNEKYTNVYCKNAKVILTNDYVNELQKHIFNALQILVK